MRGWMAGCHDRSGSLFLALCKKKQTSSWKWIYSRIFLTYFVLSTQTEHLEPHLYLSITAHQPQTPSPLVLITYFSSSLTIFAMAIPPFSVPQTWATQSVHDSLTSNNPTLDVTVNPGNPVPTNAAVVAGAQIARWHDFNADYLGQAYGDILNDNPVPTVAGHPGPHTVNGLNRFKQVVIGTLFPSLAHPIQTGATVLGARLGAGLPKVLFKKDTVVDWPRRSGLSLVSDDGTHFLVGCVLMGSQWNSAPLDNARVREDVVHLPLRRVAAYCLSTDTHYGFVLTTREIVVVRVSGTAHDCGQPCRIEWQAVPWDASGPGTLTFNLALWCISMMSLSPAHHALCPPPPLPPERHRVSASG